jgi:hypothetical protein
MKIFKKIIIKFLYLIGLMAVLGFQESFTSQEKTEKVKKQAEVPISFLVNNNESHFQITQDDIDALTTLLKKVEEKSQKVAKKVTINFIFQKSAAQQITIRNKTDIAMGVREYYGHYEKQGKLLNPEESISFDLEDKTQKRALSKIEFGYEAWMLKSIPPHSLGTIELFHNKNGVIELHVKVPYYADEIQRKKDVDGTYQDISQYFFDIVEEQGENLKYYVIEKTTKNEKGRYKIKVPISILVNKKQSGVQATEDDIAALLKRVEETARGTIERVTINFEME